MLLFGLIIYILTKEDAILATSIPIIVFSSFNLYYSKNLRENLYNIFFRIINEAETYTDVTDSGRLEWKQNKKLHDQKALSKSTKQQIIPTGAE